MPRNVLGGNAQRAGHEIIVIGTINPAKAIVLNNDVKIYFKNSAGNLYGRMSVDSSDNVIIANDTGGDYIVLNTRATDNTQRGILINVDNTTKFPQISSQGSLRVLAADDIYLITADTINLDGDAGVDITSKSGDVVIETGGGLFVTSYERHIQIPAMLAGTPANQPVEVDFFTAGGLQFATTGSKFAFFQWELPDDWDGGDVFIEVDWFPDSAAMAGADTVQWTIEYACVAEGEVHGAGTSKTLTLTDSADNARYLSIHSRGTMPYDDANQPLTKQDHIYFKVSRNTGVANDFGGSVTVTAFEIIYNSTQIPRGN